MATGPLSKHNNPKCSILIAILVVESCTAQLFLQTRHGVNYVATAIILVDGYTVKVTVQYVTLKSVQFI